MEKIKPKKQVEKDALETEKMNALQERYSIDIIDGITQANKYIVRHKEEFIEFLQSYIRNHDVGVTITPITDRYYLGERGINNIEISFIPFNEYGIINTLLDHDYNQFNERDNVDIPLLTRLIAGGFVDYITRINRLLFEKVQLENHALYYVTRKIMITPLGDNRRGYYEKLLQAIIESEMSKETINRIIRSVIE